MKGEAKKKKKGLFDEAIDLNEERTVVYRINNTYKEGQVIDRNLLQ